MVLGMEVVDGVVLCVVEVVTGSSVRRVVEVVVGPGQAIQVEVLLRRVVVVVAAAVVVVAVVVVVIVVVIVVVVLSVVVGTLSSVVVAAVVVLPVSPSPTASCLSQAVIVVSIPITSIMVSIRFIIPSPFPFFTIIQQY